jgi:hypothetical protein
MESCTNTSSASLTPLLTSSSESPSLTGNTTKVSGFNFKKFIPSFLLSERQVCKKTDEDPQDKKTMIIMPDITDYNMPLSEREKIFNQFLAEVAKGKKEGIYVPKDYIQHEEDIYILNTCSYFSQESQNK